MDIETALLTHAVDNAWGKPQADQQFILKLGQVTSASGTKGAYHAPGFSYTTPDSTTSWLLYEFGGINPSSIGMENRLYVWTTLQELVEDEDMVINPLVNHRSLPLHLVQVYLLKNNHLIFAVDIDGVDGLLDETTDFYLRVYSNKYFSSDEGGLLEGVCCDSTSVDDLTDASTLLANFNETDYADSGNLYWFKNGWLVPKPTMSTISVGDTIGYLWDSAGITSFESYLTDLSTFVSTLDSASKYLITLPEHISADFMFYDDVDIYIYSTDSDGNERGVYYSRLSENHLRQVGLREWAIDVNRVEAIIDAQGDEMLSSDAKVKVYLRNNSTPELDALDGQYLKDLYNLDWGMRNKILRADITSIDKWKALNLESSNLNSWLSLSSNSISADDMYGVFNYYGIERALTRATEKGGGWALPELALDGCLVLEFDAEGLMIGYTVLTADNLNGGYYTGSDDCVSIKIYPGGHITSAASLDVVSNYSDDAVSEFDEDRFYYSDNKEVFVLATVDVDYTYDSDEDTVDWDVSRYGGTLYKRLANQFAIKDYSIDYSEIGYPIAVLDDFEESSTGFGFSHYDVWVNGQRGIFGLDYTVSDDLVYLTNRHYIDTTTDVDENSQTAEVLIVAYGLPSATQSVSCGFVANELITMDTTVEIVENRNDDFTLSGCVSDTDAVYLGENYKGEQTFTITDTEIISYLSENNYLAGEVIIRDSLMYVAKNDITSGTVFSSDDWERIWSNNPYYDSVNGYYIQLYNNLGILYQTVVATDDDVEAPENDTAAITGVELIVQKGIPKDTTIDNGVPYAFHRNPRWFSRFKCTNYSESMEEAAEVDTSISSFISTFSEQYEDPNQVVLSSQYCIVSPFTRQVIDLLRDGTIDPSGSNLSDAAIDYALKDYTYLLEIDPVASETLDFDYINCFAHAELETISLSAKCVSFLERMNELYFSSRVNVTRDVTIET